MRPDKQSNVWQRVRVGISVFLVAVMLAPSLSLSIAPKQAHAQDVGGAAVSIAACLVSSIVGGFLGAAGGAVAAVAAAIAVPVNDTGANVQLAAINSTSAATAGSSWQQLVKECVLDTLVWALKEMIIQQLMRDVIGWIEGGFEGSPGFVQDTGRWFKDLGEEFLEDVLFESGLAELCEPFRADIQFSMYLDMVTPKYTSDGGGKMRCNLDDFLDGATFDVFVENGDFNSAGITGLFGIQMKNNNPVSGYMSLQQDLGKRLQSNVISPVSNMLAYGNGFLSTKCDEDGDPENGNESTCTPGKFIQEQLSEHAGAPLQELIAADEFAEILNALIAAFVREVLNDDDGLLGKSRQSRDAGGYWDSARDGGSGTDVTEDWCALYPAMEGCAGFEPEPPEPVDPVDPPVGELTPEQIEELNDYRADLFVAVNALSMNISTRGAAIRNLYNPQVLAIQSDLSRVDTTAWEAYGELNDIRERIRVILAALGIVTIPLPAPLAVPPPPPEPAPPAFPFP